MTAAQREAPTQPDGLTVGEVAAEARVAPSAVRFYERHGLVTARRTPGNARRFDDDAGCRIRVARVAQRVGLTVREIADILADLPTRPEPQDWAALTVRLITEARRRMAELDRALSDLGSGQRLCDLEPVRPAAGDGGEAGSG